jgi:hypothetical protein
LSGSPLAEKASVTIPVPVPTAQQTERVWAAADGTICLLATCDTPPMYVVSLVRDREVLRERRLYGRASAQVVAQGWRQTFSANC